MIKQNIQIQGDTPNIWFIFSAEKLLVPYGQSGPLIEAWNNLQFAHAYKEQVVQIGEHNGHICYLVDMGNEQVLQQDIHLTHLRSLLLQDDLEVFAIAARAWQIALFLRTHRFCGQCGSTMQKIDWEMAMHCHRCNHRCYPRISPCIIVAIRHEDKILLAQGKPQKERNACWFCRKWRNTRTCSSPRSIRRSRCGSKKFALCFKSTLAISTFINGRFFS